MHLGTYLKSYLKFDTSYHVRLYVTVDYFIIKYIMILCNMIDKTVSL